MSYMPKDQRRAEIVEAAIKVIDAEGIAAATVRRVAQSIPVSPGQIHHHFASADALRAEAFLELWHRLGEAYFSQIQKESKIDTIVNLMAGGEDEEAKASFKRFYLDLAEAAKMSKVLLDVRQHILKIAYERRFQLLKEAQQAGELSENLNLNQLSLSLMALSFGLSMLEETAFQPMDTRAILRRAIDVENSAANNSVS
ncbi:TetR family transcriptional regulator [uncultured Cohaesibacter sp.]|uniref:TetR family transcriptional regulator n=1 Tax=uncultured Cohaesibacter sp. TaxID=1002546 RepID=UPI0029C7CD4B|nr:TetR family transcriptional regulator [uncultured Cohaesibacter sp.]